jgi:hypothetical protein
MFTVGVFNKLKVIELLPPSPNPSPTLSSTYVNDLFKNDNPIPPPGFAVMTPYSREGHNFLSDDDLYN